MKKRIIIIAAALMLTLSTAMSVSAAFTGWVKDGSNWYYYRADGTEASGWEKVGDYWYYFDAENSDIMVSSTWMEIEGKYYRFDGKGHMLADKWYQEEDGNWYYLNSDGSAATGWKKVGGYWYYFDTEYYCMYFDGIYHIEGHDYCFDVKGHMLANKWYRDENDNWFYFKAGGEAASGWEKLGNYWYYLDPKQGNIMAEDERVRIDGSYYRFDKSGRMLSGTWYKSIYEHKFSYGVEVEDIWHYYSSGGKEATEWAKIGGKWYYFDPWSDNEMVHDLLYFFDDDLFYLFNPSGDMAVNSWSKYGPNAETDNRTYWFYVGADGKGVDGWQKIGGYWYYFNPTYKYMYSNGTFKIDGEYYQFDSDGRWIR